MCNSTCSITPLSNRSNFFRYGGFTISVPSFTIIQGKRVFMHQIETRRYVHKYWQLYAMMILPFIYFIVFKYIPMFGNVLAFRRYRPGLGVFGSEWVGLRYFKMFFKDPAFWRAFRNTIGLSLLNLVINFPIPIIFALLLNEIRNLFFKKAVQTISYMPSFI